MKPRWEELHIEAGLGLAERLARDATLRDPRLLVHARHKGAFLGVISMTLSSPWALVVVVAEVRDSLLPITLNTVIPTNRPEYVARGAAWWPTEGPRWLWVVGRLQQSSEKRAPRVRVASRDIPVGAGGWFAYIQPGLPGQDMLRRRGVRRGYLARPVTRA